MLIIKRVDGEIRYAYDPTASSKRNHRGDLEESSITPLPVEHGKCSSNCKKFAVWYLENEAHILKIVDIYTRQVESFIQDNKDNPALYVSLNRVKFQKHLVHALYWSSASRFKTFV